MENENVLKAYHAADLLIQDLREIYAHAENEAIIILASEMIDKVADVECKLRQLCKNP